MSVGIVETNCGAHAYF